MGTAITPEILSQIKSKKIQKKNDEISNENKFSKKIKRIKYKEIVCDIYSSHIKQEKNENIILENNINEKILKKNNEDINLNNIFFQRHKSFDSSINFFKKFDILNSNDKIESEDDEIFSEKNNISIDSDYSDISSDFLYFNKKIKRKKMCKIKKKMEIQSKKIRDSYYNKLISKLAWNPYKKEKIINNLFFFDWDDTLLCTSYLQPTGALIDMEINKRDKEVITNLDSIVSKLLIKTMNLGIVFIVTNGAPGWVELSSTKFYPKTAKLLQKIKVISARGLCEKKYPGDMRQWKNVAFKFALDSLDDINKNIITNIICFGDSIIEMEASYNLKEYFPDAYLKTIKFKESPTHNELEKELKIISSQLDSIINNYNKNLSVKVIRKKNE
jgi:hypothetical protein